MKADLSAHVEQTHQPRLARLNSPLLWLICLAPAGYLALFYSFVLRARLALGTWPLPYQPDPKALGFDIHYAAVLLALPLWMVSPLAVLLLVALHHALDEERSFYRSWSLHCCTWWLGWCCGWIPGRSGIGSRTNPPTRWALR